MKRFPAAVLVLLALFLSGCGTTKWEALTEKKAELQWPPAPMGVKVQYLGELHTFRQTGTSLKTLIFGRSTSGEILKPVAVAVGRDGRMAIADPGLKGVHLFNPTEKKYRLLYKSDARQMISPVSVAFDDALRLYVSDSQLSEVLIFDQEGNYIRSIQTFGRTAFGDPAGTPFGRPTGLALQRVGDEQQLYVVDTGLHQVHIFSTDGDYLKSFGSRGIEDGRFNAPTHIAAAPDKEELLINDAMNFRVQFVHPDGHFLSEFGHHGDGSGDFAMPKGVAIDRWGIIYVVDTLFDNVQLFSRDGVFLLTIGGRGTGAGEFWMPSGIFIDNDDKLYVCDTYNKRIQIFKLYGKALDTAQ